MTTRTRCPFLKEVVMLYCDACPSKKLLPRNQVSSVGRCATSEFEECQLYREIVRGIGHGGSAIDAESPDESKEARP